MPSGSRAGSVWPSPISANAVHHAEVAAREQARRAQDELAQWFEISGSGMLVYDASGLIVRCNAAFEALVEHVPEVLDEAAPELQSLLAWERGGMSPALMPGAVPLESQALVALPGGRRRRLSARLACWAGDDGRRRVMAVVQDRSAEDELDLAQLEMGMLMDTASVGVATYDPAHGWLAPGAAGGARARGDDGGEARGSSALLGVGRELVQPGSLPEFERLQRALRAGQRTEVRYAVRHPELGERWLLTRVEPGALAGGRLVESFLHGVRPGDPATLGATLALVLFVALAAGAIPAWRAARMNPVEALRYE